MYERCSLMTEMRMESFDTSCYESLRENEHSELEVKKSAVLKYFGTTPLKGMLKNIQLVPLLPNLKRPTHLFINCSTSKFQLKRASTAAIIN